MAVFGHPLLLYMPRSLADRTLYSRAIATGLRPSVSSVCTECIVAKRCVLEQKLV